MKNECAECHREIDPSGESLTEDQHWMCETCIQKVTVSPGAVVVPLLIPVYHKMTVSLEEHVWYWLKSHPREKASWMLTEAVESKIC
jgi:DNA-directed RNA polymerase subunit RPC12/RpoP